MRVCVFVDGENLRHSITDLFDRTQFLPEDYLPKQAQWAALFDSFVDKATDGKGTRHRTYWYVVSGVDPYPWKIPNPNKDTDKAKATADLKALALKNDLLCQHLGIKTDTDMDAKIDDAYQWLKRSSDNIKKRFAGHREVQAGIALKHKAIEFRRSGSISFNLTTGQFGQEKTVDVNLGVDMVLLKDIYDVALIVSGDQDYVPAAQAVKNMGKHVVNLAFVARNGKLLPGGARRLNEVTDWSVAYDYQGFGKLLKLLP